MKTKQTTHMTHMTTKTLATLASLIAILEVAPPAAAAKGSAASREEPAGDAATREDIQRTLGFVPTFFQAVPPEGLAGAWDEMKALQLNPNSALPGKVKELIGLGVSAQIPCRYCIYFHTQAARLNGAGELEIKEAVAMAALTRHWSTILNGNQIDKAAFRKEVAQVVDHVKKTSAKPAVPARPVTDAASAYEDMERTLGLVPSFFRAFPPEAIGPAWREFKGIQLNPATALPGKYKELVGLAVAAQIPCEYCVFFHTEAARLNGASDAEIREAIGMAAVTRHWSTILNGNLIDEAAFRRDTDQVMRNARKAKTVSAK
jgi:AhpD family alkylhydroperoxidase